MEIQLQGPVPVDVATLLALTARALGLLGPGSARLPARLYGVPDADLVVLARPRRRPGARDHRPVRTTPRPSTTVLLRPGIRAGQGNRRHIEPVERVEAESGGGHEGFSLSNVMAHAHSPRRYRARSGDRSRRAFVAEVEAEGTGYKAERRGVRSSECVHAAGQDGERPAERLRLGAEVTVDDEHVGGEPGSQRAGDASTCRSWGAGKKRVTRRHIRRVCDLVPGGMLGERAEGRRYLPGSRLSQCRPARTRTPRSRGRPGCRCRTSRAVG